MLCAACQFENEPDALFCEQCGERLEHPCPTCGTVARAEARFCRKCGQRLTPAGSAAAPAGPLPVAAGAAHTTGADLTDQPRPAGTALDERLDRLQRYLPTHLANKILAGRGRLEGERKVITVLFADVVGYTALAEGLGEERIFHLMDRVFELLIHEVHRYEGTVNELTGDGIVAFFGAPLAVENAPQRAVLAALAMQRQIAAFAEQLAREQDSALRIRVGVNSGPVIVGTIGNNLRMDYKAVGDTVNLAARMQQLASPGAVVITSATHRLVQDYFLWDDLGLVDVKGKADRLQAYRVVGERRRRGRIDVGSEHGLTPLVGRDRELELLRDCYERAKSGRGQVFSIVGEAGLGKSRLVYEFQQALAGEQVTFLEGRCAPYATAVPYFPIIDILRQNFGIEPGDTGENAAGKINRQLERLGLRIDDAFPYLRELLSVEPLARQDDIAKGLPPEVLRQRTFEAIRTLTLRAAELRPVVILIEDLHWCDKASNEFNRFLLEHIAGARVLLLFTYRPEFAPTWPGKSYVSAVTLARMSNREAYQMLTGLLAGAAIEERLAEMIIDKSDGVPFFIEELVKSLREASTIGRRDGRWTLLRETELHVPDTIDELLSTRIDRLPDAAKRVLQIGSVIGREFHWRLLSVLAEMSEMELVASLSALKEAELIYERGVHPNTFYVFKHAFTEDVAYASLLVVTRRQIHQRVGEAIEAQLPEAAEEAAGVLAHHFLRSGDTGKALEYLVRSGERSQRVYANAEAVHCFSEALRILETLPPTDNTRSSERIALALRLGALHELLGHYAESLSVTTHAHELAEAAGDAATLDRLENRIGQVRYSMGDIQGAIACLQRALLRAEQRKDARLMAVSCRHLGVVHFSSGSLGAATDFFLRALRISEEAQNSGEVATACILLSNAHDRIGNLDEAVAWGRRALNLCDALNDDRRAAWACIMLCQALIHQGGFEELPALRERAVRVFERVGDFRGRSWLYAMDADRARVQRDFEAAIELRQTEAAMARQSGGFQHEFSAGQARLGECYARIGQSKRALECCQESLAVALKMSNKLEYGYAYMVLAEVYASNEYRDWARAAWYFEESLKAFREVGAQLDVARAYLAGARISLLKADGKAPELAQMGRELAASRGARPLAEEAEEILAQCRETQSS
jgi:class 3 adenylate cyclase/tetratricopeptide (TPR) repeat protein